VHDHFTQFVEDQMDFHGYSMRKMTLQAYSDLLRFTDRIHNHHFYLEATLLGNF
jgi:hypothetical protein